MRAFQALLIIDVQAGFDGDPYWGGERNNPHAEARMEQLLEAWRHAQLPIVHVQHASTSAMSPLRPNRPGYAFKPGFAPRAGEHHVIKHVNSAFIGTDLQAHLDTLGVRRVIIVGLTTDHCVSTTVRMAANLGFDTFVVCDATAAFPRTGPSGERYCAEQVHDVALASLREFAHLTTVAHLLDYLHTAASLRDAQRDGLALVERIEAAGIVQPGRSERDMSQAILDLAKQHTPPVQTFWHKRIVRVGRNTVETYRANPPDLVLQPTDLAFMDLGPVLGTHEADLGRTYVFGDDPDQRRLVDDLARLFEQGQALYMQQPAMTGAQLYQGVVAACAACGWNYGNYHCGHLVGAFPHEHRLGESAVNYICADNHVPMSTPAAAGELRHWILEIHLVHPARGFGGFYEQLLVP